MALVSFSGGCGPPAEDVGAASQRMNGHNQLDNHRLSENAMTGNRQALEFLAGHSLTEATDGTAVFPDYPEMRYQLHDEGAREAMRYIVSCALDETGTLEYQDPFSEESATITHSFTGELGLCPDWKDNPPSQACLERVSGCMLARVNAVGARVAISLRGDAPFLPMSAVIPTDSHYDDASDVKSFLSCATPTSGPGRSCGFHPISVGACDATTWVTVGAGAGADGCDDPFGLSTGDAMLRVCTGIYGCDPETPPFALLYAGRIGENDDRCGLSPSVTFKCPQSGYYSVMAGTYRSDAPQDDITDPAKLSVEASAGSFPATEVQVFTYVEGAFYGNLFDGDALADSVTMHVQWDGRLFGTPQYGGVLYENMFSCYSPIWADGLLTLKKRLCAGPHSGQCVMHISGACAGKPSSDLSTLPPHRCATFGADGTGEYDGCFGSSEALPPWEWPVTTYLNQPCDVVEGPDGGPNGPGTLTELCALAVPDSGQP